MADNMEFKKTGNAHQQFHADTSQPKSYDSERQRKIYQSSQQSFNEQRDQYTETAYNDYPSNSYNYEQNMPDEDSPSGEDASYSRYRADGLSTIQNTGNMPSGTDSPIPGSGTEWKKTYGIDKAHEEQEQLPDKVAHKKSARVIRTSQYESQEEPDSDERVSLILEKGRKGGKARQRLQSAGDFKESVGGRLQFRITTKEKTKREYEAEERQKNRKKYRDDMLRSSAYKTGKKLLNDENIEDDEDMKALTMKTKHVLRASRLLLRSSMRNIRKNHNAYERLQTATDKENLLRMKREKVLRDAHWKAERANIKASEASKKAKQQRKKQMVQERAKQEGNFFRRAGHNFKIKKKAAEQKAKTVKKVFSTIASVGVIILVIVFLFLFLFLVGGVFVHSAADIYAETTVQVDYSVMADATAYFRKLETDLEEYLSDKETLEEALREQYGDDIYEFVYELSETGFSANTLIAYLGAQYGEFTLEDVQEELDSIFEEMYTLAFETAMEDREITATDPSTGSLTATIELKKICHIILEKKELEEVVEGRLDDDKRKQYEAYRLSTGGQQVYGPVMQEDWTSLISSNYGERIHPITKVRTFHYGVDIAVPEGTKLYSAVDGTVTTARYSDSAGYMVTVTTKTGWIVTFMHMQGYAVAAGQTIAQGDFVGYSGNTGRSTGPHLHLQVADPSGQTVNPIFIIPQTCAKVKQKE